MKFSRYFTIILISVLAVITNSCDRKITPAHSVSKQKKEYDIEKYNLLFFEGIENKLFGNLTDALENFDHCIKINPESDASYYKMAQILLTKGDIEGARTYVSKAHSIDEKNIWYLMMLAGLFHQEQNIDSAIFYYQKAATYFPSRKSIISSIGNLYAEKGDYNMASKIFKSLEEKIGVNEITTPALIQNLVAAGRYEDAILTTKQLIDAFPDEGLYIKVLAEIYTENGDERQAMAIYDSLIAVNPDDPQTQLSLCDFFITGEKYDELQKLLSKVILNDNITRDEKIALFAKLLDLDDYIQGHGDNFMLLIMILEANYKDDNIIVRLRPELLVKMGKLADAVQRLEEIINDDPNNYYAWEKSLFVYLQMKDYKKLMQKGEECATRFNKSFIAKLLYADGAMECEDYETALNELRKAEILAGSNKEFNLQVLTIRADVYYRMKEYSKAFETFENAVENQNEDITILNNYAYYLAEQDMKLKQAEKMAKKVIDTEKDNITYLDTYAWVLYKRGKINEAAKVMEEILNSNDKINAELYEHFGFILKKQKNCERAVEMWDIAVDIDSTKTDLKKEIENCIK